MAKQKRDDSIPSFGELLTQWERDFNNIANQLMGSEGFSQAMNVAQQAQVQVQKAMIDGLSRQRETFNLPTRDDVLRLAESVNQLHRRLERLEEKLGAEDELELRAQRKAPARTRKPPAEYLEQSPHE